MFKSKYGVILLTLLLALSVVLSGCTKDKSAKQAVQESLTKSSELKSYNFKGNLKFQDFNFPDAELSDSEAVNVANLLKSAELSWSGAYRADPMMMEINLQLALKGDLAITINVPIVMTNEKVWIKVPNIPILPIPEELIGKFIELDLKELAEQSGQPLPNVDAGKTQLLVNDVLAIVFKHIEEEKYLTDVPVKDAGLPEGVVVDQVVQFHMDQSQLEPFMYTVIDKIAPEVIELLSSNQEYRDLLQLKQEDLDTAKKELDSAKNGKLSEDLAELKKELKSLDIKANVGIDKEQYPVYTDATIHADIASEELTGSLGIKVVSELTEINKEVKFANGEPKAEDIIPMEELEKQLNATFGGVTPEAVEESL